MRQLVSVLLVSAISAVAFASAVGAAPIVSVDVDPSTAGVQASADVLLATSFDINITISDVDPLQPLQAFQFDLFFDPSVLTAISVSDGGFLSPPSFVIQNVGVISVEFAATTLGIGTASGDGVLASITFDAIGEGLSALDLSNVILAASFGVPIVGAAINDGVVRVGTTAGPIPEPTSALLYGAGFVALGSALRRSRGRHDRRR